MTFEQLRAASVAMAAMATFAPILFFEVDNLHSSGSRRLKEIGSQKN